MNRKNEEARRIETEIFGRMAIAHMLHQGMSEEEIGEKLRSTMEETLKEMVGNKAVQELKHDTSFRNMIDKGAYDPDDE